METSMISKTIIRFKFNQAKQFGFLLLKIFLG